MAGRTPPLVALVESAAQMGGVEYSTLYLAEEMDPARFRRVVVCPGEGDLPRQCREYGIPMVLVLLPRLFSTSIRLGRHPVANPLAWAANLLGLLLAARRLARVLRQQGVDLVCTKGLPAHFYGGVAARWAGLPCVWHVQDLVSDRAGGLYSWLLGVAAHRLARYVIVDGQPIAEQLAPFVPATRLGVIHNGVDTTVFSPDVDGSKLRREWRVDTDDILIGNVARLTRWKGQDHLVRAFAALADDFPYARLVLVGSPVFDSAAYELELRRLVVSLGLSERVIFAGYRRDLPEVLAALDIFVHASINKDTSPLAVVSAMAAGKPIVSTDVAGVSELFVSTGEVLLVAPADASALAAGLRRVLASAAYRTELGHAARHAAVQRLSLPQFTRRCEAVFTQVLAG